MIYQLKITLQNTQPSIWRKVLVDGNTDLQTLHEIFQVVMGWENAHLWSFNTARGVYAPDASEWDMEVKEAGEHTLSEIVQEVEDDFRYIYDYGDDWVHFVEVEELLEKSEVKEHPVCTKGKRACPPENCGGVWGYHDFLKAIKDKRHPEHEDMLDWVGGKFDPDKFNMKAINRELKEV